MPEDKVKDAYSTIQGSGIFIDESDFREQLKANPKEVFDLFNQAEETNGIFIDYDDFTNSLGMGKSKPEVGSSPSLGTSTQLPELELTTAIRFRKDMQGARSAKDIDAIFNKPEYKGMKQYAETFKGLSPQDAMQKMRETPISPSSQKAISYLSKEPAKFYAEQRDETIKGANLAATNIIQARESAKASEQLLDGAGQMLVQYQQTNDPTPIIEMLGQFGIQADESNWSVESQKLINAAQEQLKASVQSEQENMKVYDLASKQSETFDRAVVAYNNDVIRRESKSTIGKYAFQDYIVNYDDIVKAREKDKAQESEAKLQGSFGRMVDSFTGVSNLITKSLAAVDYMDRQWYAAAMGNETDLRNALEDSYLKQMDILELEMPNADAERLSKDYFGSANPADWNWYKIGNDVGQVTGSMIPIMAASLVNPALAVGAGTGLVYGDLFESAKKGGMEDNQAALFAGTLSTVIGGLERMSGVPLTKYFQGELGKRLAARYAKDLLTKTSVKDITKAAIDVAYKGAKNMVGEVATEVAQEGVEGGSKMILNEAGFDFQDAPESLGELGEQMVDVAKSTAVGIVPIIGVGTVRTSRNAMKQIKRNTVMNHIIEIKQDPEFITNKIEYLGTQRELGKIDEKTYEGEVKALTEINDVVELYPTVSNDNLAGISELYSEKLALQEMDAKRVEKGLPKSNDKRISDIDKQIVTLSQNENQDNQIQAQEDGESTPMPEGVKVEGAKTQTDENLRNEKRGQEGRQESLLEPENVGGKKAPSVSKGDSVAERKEKIRKQAKEEIAKVLDDDTFTEQQKEEKIKQIVDAAKAQMNIKESDLNQPSIKFELPTLTVEVSKPFAETLNKLGYSDADIYNMTIDQQWDIVNNKTQKAEVASSAKVDAVKENARQERIAAMQAELDQPQSPTQESIVSENPELKDVESTEKALGSIGANKDLTSIIPISTIKQVDDINKQAYESIIERQKKLLSEGKGKEISTDKEIKDLKNIIDKSEKVLSGSPKELSEAYHAAKKDGSNPKLVKAVEQLLGKPKEQAEAEKTQQSLSDIDAEIERLKKEKEDEFDRTSSGNTVIAADYLFTGGKGVMLSTDYLLQALVGSFPAATKKINEIRSKYASKIGNIKDDVNTSDYNAMMEEVREAINATYENKKAEEIFNKILQNPTGFTSREGNIVSSELDAINEENDAKINAKYDKQIAELEAKKKTEQTQKQNEQAEAVEQLLGKPKEATPQAGSVVGEEVEAKRIETEAKIKRKDLFSDGGVFANELGGSGVNSVPTNHSERNGIEFVQFSNPNTGIVDVIMTGKSDNDFVGYYRIYENGKATNKWSSKFENQSRNKEDFKTMISGVQEMLPQGHEYTEKTSISTDGLRIWNQQLNRGYELQYDDKGNLITNRVAINGDAINNELGIAVNKGNFENVSVTNNADMKKVKEALLPYLQKFGLNESNIHFENGTVEIDLPVLKSNKAVEELLTPNTNAKEQQSFSMREQSVQETTKRSSDSDLPKVNETKLSDGEKAAEQKEVAESKPKESAETKAERRKRELAELKKAASDVRKVDGIDAFEQAKRKALADRAILDFHIKNIKEDIGDAIKTIKDYAKSIGESIDEIMQDAWDVVTNNTPIPNKYNEPKKLRSASLATEINRTLRVKNAPVFVATQKAVNKAFAIGEAQAREEFVQSMKDLKSDFKEFIEYFTEQAKEETKSKLDSKSAKFKAFRDGQKAFAKVFNDTLKSAQEKNFITPFEYRMLARRASLAQTEGQWNKLMDLTNRVLSDASYRQKLAEAERLQKQANQKKHGQAADEVTRFTRISPEDIAPQRLDDYIDALADLALPIPKYGKMISLIFDIESDFKKSNPDLFTGKTDSQEVGAENVNKAFERAAEAFDSAMEAMNKGTITIDDYKLAVKEASIAMRNLNKVISDIRTLYERDKISDKVVELAEQQYDDVADRIGKNLQELAEKFPSQVDQLVNDLVTEINDKLPNVDKSKLTKSEKDLFDKLELYNNSDLKKLTPLELDFYNELLTNFINEGYFDIQRFKAVQSALFAATKKDKTADFVNGIKETFDERFDNLDRAKGRMAVQFSSSWQGALTGFGKLFAGALDFGFINPMMSALKKADDSTRNFVRKTEALLKKHGLQQSAIFGEKVYTRRQRKLGMVAAYLREYGLSINGEPKNVDKREANQMEGERDVFRRLGEGKDVDGAYKDGYTDSDGYKIDKEIYDAFPKTKKVRDNNNDYLEVDPKDVYESIFINQDNKFLNAKERAFMMDYYELLKELEDMQRAANAINGKPFKPVMFYHPRQSYGNKDVRLATPFTISDKNNFKISLQASSGKEVVTEMLRPMNNNLLDVFHTNAEETSRNYYVLNAIMDINSLAKSVKPELDAGKTKYVSAMMNKINDAMNDHYIFPNQTPIQRGLSQLSKAGFFRIFVDFVRAASEIIIFGTFGPFRMGVGLKAYRNIPEVTNNKTKVVKLMSDLGSMFDRSLIAKDIDVREGRIESEKLNSYITRLFAAAAENIFKRMLWYTRFQQEFYTKTGEKFNIDKYNNSLEYRKKFREAIEESTIGSDKSFEIIAGSVVRGGRRRKGRTIRIPGRTLGLDVDDVFGQAITLFTGYPFRGFVQAVDGISDLKNQPSATKARDAFYALLGTLGESMMYQTLITIGGIASAMFFLDDDDEEDKKEKELLKQKLEDQFSVNTMSLRAFTSALGMLSVSANGLGKIIAKTVATVAYSNADTPQDKQMIVEFMREVQYGRLTDYSKIKNDAKLKEALYLDLFESSGFLGLTELARVTVDSYNAYKNIDELYDTYENGTPEQKEKATDTIILMHLFVKAVNIIGTLSAFKGKAFNLNFKTLNEMAKPLIEEAIPSKAFLKAIKGQQVGNLTEEQGLYLNEVDKMTKVEERNLMSTLRDMNNLETIILQGEKNQYTYTGEEYIQELKKASMEMYLYKIKDDNFKALSGKSQEQLKMEEAYDPIQMFVKKGDSNEERTIRMAILKNLKMLPDNQVKELKEKLEGKYDKSYYNKLVTNDFEIIFELTKDLNKQ